MMELVIGGSGSGKSAYAETAICREHCRSLEEDKDAFLYYIADMIPYGAETEKKIAHHREMRAGKGFQTLEWYYGLAEHITAPDAPPLEGASVLLECISNLTANEMYEPKAAKMAAAEAVIRGVQMLHERCRNLVVVTNDVFRESGSDSEEMVLYKKNLARINRALAEEADNIASEKLDSLLENQPVKEPELTEREVMDSWPVKERNRYLSLETKCAVIGKFIHPDGDYSAARSLYMERMAAPKSVKENGRDTLVYTYYPNVDATEVEALFFSLQAEHRSAQAELNGMKHNIEQTIAKDKAEKSGRWTAAHEKWAADVALAREELNRERERKSKEVEAFKIVIPDNLRQIYERLRKF